MIKDCSPISTHPERCNIPQDAMAVDGRPSISLCWLACARSSSPRIPPSTRPSRAPSSAYDAPGSPVTLVMPACQGAPTHTGRSPVPCLHKAPLHLPPNAPWGRSVSEARRAYPLFLLPVKGPRIQVASLHAWRSARNGEDHSPPPDQNLESLP